MIRYQTVPATSKVRLTFEGSAFAACELWIPEGISTPRGLAGFYPAGMPWRETGQAIRQEAHPEHLFGPGNVIEVEPGVLECCGIRYKKEPGIPWKSSIRLGKDRVDFTLSLHNPHDETLPDVAAMLCLKFTDGDWWTPDAAYMATGDGIRSISQVRWIEGARPQFQKWNIGEESVFDNPVKNGIWTSSPDHAFAPAWVVRPDKKGPALVFRCDSAYYIHCNRNNPCNDIAMKFGDLPPGATMERSGFLALDGGPTGELLPHGADAGDV